MRPRQPVPFLSFDDLVILRWLVQEKRKEQKSPINRQGIAPGDDTHQAPEVYIALPQESTGIPAMTRGIGTGSGGTDTPGSATCDVYKIVDGELESTGLSKEVFNLTDSAIPHDWILILRDKFGRWVVPPVGSAAVRFQITQSGVGTGTGTDDDAAAVYRTSHPSGLYAQQVSAGDVANGSDELIYADKVRAVYATGDVVWCEKLDGVWQIRDDGVTSWRAVAAEDLLSGGPGLVTLYHRTGSVQVDTYLFDTADSVSAGTTCLVHWLDGLQQFYAIPVVCPNPIVE